MRSSWLLSSTKMRTSRKAACAALVTIPESVIYPSASPSGASMRKPNEAAASWLVAKGSTRKSAARTTRPSQAEAPLRLSLAPSPKKSACAASSGAVSKSPATFCSVELLSTQARFMYTTGAQPSFARPRSTTPRPLVWSPCSWVMSTASSRAGSKPASSQRSRKSRLQIPQSISTPAPDSAFSTMAALPLLPLASTCNFSMGILLFWRAWLRPSFPTHKYRRNGARPCRLSLLFPVARIQCIQQAKGAGNVYDDYANRRCRRCGGAEICEVRRQNHLRFYSRCGLRKNRDPGRFGVVASRCRGRRRHSLHARSSACRVGPVDVLACRIHQGGVETVKKDGPI